MCIPGVLTAALLLVDEYRPAALVVSPPPRRGWPRCPLTERWRYEASRLTLLPDDVVVVADLAPTTSAQWALMTGCSTGTLLHTPLVPPVEVARMWGVSGPRGTHAADVARRYAAASRWAAAHPALAMTDALRASRTCRLDVTHHRLGCRGQTTGPAGGTRSDRVGYTPDARDSHATPCQGSGVGGVCHHYKSC